MITRLSVLICVFFLLCACAARGYPESGTTAEPELKTEETMPESAPEPEAEPEAKHIRIVAAGDNLLHNTLSIASRTDDGYDFSPLYQYIKPILTGADLAFINQEVMLTGEEGKYPLLSAPFEAADALKLVGFNVINLATNHSLDKGEKGLRSCIEYVSKTGFDGVLGAFLTEEDADKPFVIEKQGVRFGFLSYAYGLNGYSLPKDKTWMISLIDEQKIVKDVKKITPLCDYLIVSMHWGNEYVTEPSVRQQELAQLLCDNGVDLVIGHHPHVLQPVKTLTNQTGEQMICAYSLGNLISGQQKRATMLGGILDVELEVLDGKITPVSFGVIPVVTHYGSKMKGAAVYPLSEYSDELTAVHAVRQYESPVDMAYFTKLAADVLGEHELSWTRKDGK